MTYSYSFDKEIFIGPFDSVEEAIAQARKAVEPDKPKHVLRTLGSCAASTRN